jgi:hypothetical protein
VPENERQKRKDPLHMIHLTYRNHSLMACTYSEGIILLSLLPSNQSTSHHCIVDAAVFLGMVMNGGHVIF